MLVHFADSHNNMASNGTVHALHTQPKTKYTMDTVKQRDWYTRDEI